MDELYNVRVARFPGDNSEHPASSEYAANLRLDLAKDPHVKKADSWYLSETPVTMSRNRCIKEAIRDKVDILVMIDSDIAPDVAGNAEKQFWPDAFAFMRQRWNFCPTIIGAPYVGPKPAENIYVFLWRQMQNDCNDMHFMLEQYNREEAASMAGISEVAALPTGLVAIDMRLFTGFKHPRTGEIIKMIPPYFYYEWADKEQTHKASTEDVTFTRDANLLFRCAGIGQVCYCNWSSWAVHIKLASCLRPAIITGEEVGRQVKDALVRYDKTPGRMSFVGDGYPELPPPTSICPDTTRPKANNEIFNRISHNHPASNCGKLLDMVNHGIKAEHIAALG